MSFGTLFMMMVMCSPSLPPPWPVCLHSLLNDVVPYWRQIVPSTTSLEAWFQGSYVNSLLLNYLDSVVKISAFFNWTEYSGCSKCMFCNLWDGRTGSPLLVESLFQESFWFTYIHCLTFFTLDLIYRSHHVLFTHQVLGFHQQLP